MTVLNNLFFPIKHCYTSVTAILIYSYRLYIDVYVLLCTLYQPTLPYHTTGVDSNDELFGGTEEYKNETKKLLSFCAKEIKKQLVVLKGDVQCPCAFFFISELTNRILITSSVCTFISEILDLIPEENLRSNHRIVTSTLSQVEVKVENAKNLCSDLSDSMAIQTLLNFIENCFKILA